MEYNKRDKILITTIVISLAIIVLSISYYSVNKTDDNNELINCLRYNNVEIYGSTYCGACQRLINDINIDYESLVKHDIFIDCDITPTKCRDNMQTKYFPEIHINNKLVGNNIGIVSLLEKINCTEPSQIQTFK